MIRTISVPSGIGDSIWLFQKLINTGEKFNFNLPNGIPQRSKPIFDLLPDLVNSSQYIPGLSYKFLANENIQNIFKNFKQITAPKFMLSMNNHLESGNRIEKFFPDLKTSFALPYKTDPFTDQVLKDFPSDKKYIGIYGSSYSTTRAWGFWGASEWCELIKLIHKSRPDLVFVLIGASFDLDLAGDLSLLLDQYEIPYKSTVGNGLGYVGELMKVLSFAFYFPSGLPIFSESLQGCNCLMFYSPTIKGIMGNWASPERIENGNINEQLFDTVENVYKWFKEIYKFESII